MLDLLGCLRARQALQEAIHDFFRQRDYLSLDTPIAVRCPGTEVHLQYFATEWIDYRQQGHQLFLRSSPELHLKQALSLGIDRVYHLGKCFRNEGELSPWHHPEFTLLEFYQTGIALPDFMQLTEDLLRFTQASLRRSHAAVMPLPDRFERISVFEAFRRWAGIELIDGDPGLAALGRARGFVSLREEDDFETAYFKIMLDIIEPQLKTLRAAFLYDYPASQCALARVEGGRAQRFELYVQGVELCNAFDELLDPQANRQRIARSNEQRLALGKPAAPEDTDFYAALDQGLKPCCGNALGFDRLLALLLEEPSLDRIIPFRRNQPFGPLLT